MLNKEKLEQLMGILGDLTDGQKAYLAEALEEQISEKELFEKLGVDEGRFTEFMQALAAEQEDAVMGQELSADEMESAAGGYCNQPSESGYCRGAASEKNIWNCVKGVMRYIYRGKGFPNCAATVEDGSWCNSNDACYQSSVDYIDMKDCSKAWR